MTSSWHGDDGPGPGPGGPDDDGGGRDRLTCMVQTLGSSQRHAWCTAEVHACRVVVQLIGARRRCRSSRRLKRQWRQVRQAETSEQMSRLGATARDP